MLHQTDLPSLLRGSPYNLMCEPGTLLLNGREPKNVIYVLAAWPHCVVGVAVNNKKIAGNRLTTMALIGTDFLHYRYLRHGEDWRIYELEPLAPAASKHHKLRDTMCSSLQWLVKGEMEKLPEFAARKGFPHLSTEQLRQICKLQGVTPSGNTLESLLRALVHHFRPAAPDSEIDQVLQTRGCKLESVTCRTMTETDLKHCRTDMDEAEYAAVLEEVKSDSKRRSKQTQPAQSSTDGAATSSGEQGKRKPNMLSMSNMSDEITLAEAKAFLPRVKRCSLVRDAALHYRWQVHYPCAVAPYSTSQ
eukprot:6469112-Amphidinium_carterae.5